MKIFLSLVFSTILVITSFTKIYAESYESYYYTKFDTSTFYKDDVTFENDSEFLQFFFNKNDYFFTPNEWEVDVLWTTRLDNELFIYVNENMLAFIKSYKEPYFLQQLFKTAFNIENIEYVSIFIKDNGYYLKRNVYCGNTLYNNR